MLYLGNALAHGKNTSVSINSIIMYFQKASKIIEILDAVVKDGEHTLLSKIELESTSLENVKQVLIQDSPIISFDSLSKISTLSVIINIFQLHCVLV